MKSADRDGGHESLSPGIQSRHLKRLRRVEDERTALRRENRLLRRRLDNLPLPMIRTTPDGTILDVNRAGIRMLGYSRKADLVGRSLLPHIFAPAGRKQAGELLKRWRQGGRFRDSKREFQVVVRGGENLEVRLHARAVRNQEGRLLSIILTLLPVGFLRRPDGARRSDKDLFRLYLQIAGVILVVIDREGRVTQINRKGCDVLGYPEKQILGKSWFERFIPRSERPAVHDYFDRMMRGEISASVFHENPVLTRSGEERLIAWHNTVIRDPRGNITATLSSGEDVTDRRRAEMDLREKERAHETLMNNLPGMAYRCRNDRFFTMKVLSRGCRDLTGYETEDLIDNERIAYADLIHPEDRRLIAMKVRNGVLKNHPFRMEYRIITADGQVKWVWEQGIGIAPDGGKASFLEGFITEITDRKNAEAEQKRAREALRVSEERFRLLAENIMDVIWVLDREGRFSYVSPSVERLRGYTPEEVMSQSVSEALTPASSMIAETGLQQLLERVDRGERYTDQHRFELEQPRKDGSTIWTEVIISAIYDDKQDFIGVLGVTRDISERKRIEAKIHESLREKEVMLQEIHHRVKNNMQIMSSLLRLQARRISDERTRRLLLESQGRIRSMALVHEKLYQSRDLSRIHLSDYIRSLTDSLRAAYRVDPRRCRLHVPVKEIYLDVNTAIPCGLLVNELVTNALQHAFPGDRAGEVVIELNRDHGGNLLLCVRDDGIGLPEGADIQNPATLGFQLVLDLVRQIGGRINHDGSRGSSFCITIPPTDNQAGD